MAPGPAWTLSSPAAPFGSGGVAVGHPPGALGSAAAHSFGLWGAAFAPVVPPDILDLDAWMDRENWDLGRLRDHEHRPVTTLQRLDALIAQEVNLGRNVEHIVSIGSASEWRVEQLANGGSEIQIPSRVWEENLAQLSPSVGPVLCASYKGIPVIPMPF